MGIEEQENEAEQKEAQPGVQGQGSLGRPPGGCADRAIHELLKTNFRRKLPDFAQIERPVEKPSPQDRRRAIISRAVIP